MQYDAYNMQQTNNSWTYQNMSRNILWKTQCGLINLQTNLNNKRVVNGSVMTRIRYGATQLFTKKHLEHNMTWKATKSSIMNLI